jgi:hypothetical protein
MVPGIYTSYGQSAQEAACYVSAVAAPLTDKVASNTIDCYDARLHQKLSTYHAVH